MYFGTYVGVTLAIYLDSQRSRWVYVGSHNLVCCIYCATGGGPPISEKSCGGCGFQYSFGSKLHIYTYKYTYIWYIYSLCAIHTGCVVLSGKFFFADTTHTRRRMPIEGSVAGKGVVAYIVAHSSPAGLRAVARPETVL